jgi:cobalamin biosynthesis Mg chelatase CobN
VCFQCVLLTCGCEAWGCTDLLTNHIILCLLARKGSSDGRSNPARRQSHTSVTSEKSHATKPSTIAGIAEEGAQSRRKSGTSVTSEKSHASKASSVARDSAGAGVSAGSAHGSVTGEAVEMAVEGDNNAGKATQAGTGAQEGAKEEGHVKKVSEHYMCAYAAT